MDENDDELENLSKDEQRALLLAPWTVERHDHDEGMIAYEIWCHNPYWRICSIFDNDNQYAKKCADRIVADHRASLSLDKRGEG